MIGPTEQPPLEQRARRGRARGRRAARARGAAGAAEAPEPARAERSRAAVAARAARLAHGSTALPGVRWVKKMVAFPIGERFAVISITAALFDAAHDVHRAARPGAASRSLYTLSGRVLRSIAR